MADQTLPSSLEEVESLILSLYQPNPPDVIAKTQSTLSRLQGTPQAWLLARHLLARPDEKVKFFGALTIIVKLNTESSSLAENDATELLVHLVGWYIESVNSSPGPLVTRKLASALSTFLMHFHNLWPHHIRHLVYCLASGRPCDPSSLDGSVDFAAALDSLGPVQVQAVLWVTSNVVEDIQRVDLNAPSNLALYQLILDSALDAVPLISKGLSMQSSSPRIHEDAVKGLQSWVWITQRASARDNHVVELMKPLVTTVIESLAQQGSHDASMELLTDLLSNYSTFFTQDHYEKLYRLLESDWSRRSYETLLQGDFEFDSFRFGQFLLAFGDARLLSLMQSSDDRSRGLLSSLSGLLAADGLPVAEDKIFVPAIEFWSTFAETMTDYTYSDEELENADWVQPALAQVLQSVSNAWQKIAYPPAEEFSQWDSSERVGFNDARNDVVDFLQSTFTLAGPPLVFTFAELTLSSLSSSAWLRLEAAAFCLGGLADCARDDPRCDEALAMVFTSPLFSILRTNQEHIPSRVRQTCLSLIENYTEYFERNTNLLPPALGLLFGVVGEPAMAGPASKSIYGLCSSCRRSLHSEIDAFLDEYQSLSSGRRLDCVSSERVLGAIASVIQAIPEREKRYICSARVLGFIQADVQFSTEIRTSSSGMPPCLPGARCFEDAPEDKPAFHLAMKALRCLSNVGRGFQTPSYISINLEGEDGQSQGPDDDLAQLQQRVIQVILELEDAFHTSEDVIELICRILRTGFAETEPGPFVLPPADVAHYMTRHTLDTPRVGVLVSTACSFASSSRLQGCDNKSEIITSVLLWVIGLLKQLPGPEAEPELTQNGIEFVSRLLAKDPAVLLGLQPSDAVEFFFLFTLQVLDGKEPLPKAAAAEFWTVFINLKSGESELQGAITQAMETLGPLLCQSLARNIGGGASRSELDKLSEPVKKLVGQFPKAKQWLESGLLHPSFPSSKVTSEDKSLFVKKVVSLRGSRNTNQVVRDFWVSARGSNFSYAS